MARRDEKQVWTDRGESWPSIAKAADALRIPRTSLSKAIAEGWSWAGRHWTTRPPGWAVAAMAQAERRRAASVRCNPGRFGTVLNGLDTRTGKVYAGGREVTEREGVTA